MTHLILQAPGLQPENIEKIAAIAAASGVQKLSNTAVRLLDIENCNQAEIGSECERLQIDYAFLKQIQHLRDCKILAMDMDSTLINIECIDEIADMAGRKKEVAAITEAAMRGEISDFAESLRRRVALLEGVPYAALEKVYKERLRLNTGAEDLIRTVRQAGLQVLLVSGGFTYFTERLQARLTLDHAHANTLEIQNGKLTGRVLGSVLDGQAKADYLATLAQQLDAEPDQIIAVGDGANDLKMLALATYSVAFRAKPLVREKTAFALNVSGLDAILNWFRL